LIVFVSIPIFGSIIQVYGFESTIQIPGHPQRSAVSPQEEELWEVIGGAPCSSGSLHSFMEIELNDVFLMIYHFATKFDGYMIYDI